MNNVRPRQLTPLVISLIGLLTISLAAAPTPPAPAYVEGEVIVTFKPAAALPAAKSMLHSHALQFAKHFDWLSAHRRRHTGLVRAPGRTTAELIAELTQDPTVETVEPNYLRWATAAPTPNDTLFAQL